jgi:hypothetical protein
MAPEVERKGNFLVSQTPRGELASFLQERAMRWREVGNRQYAAEAFAWALALDPANGFHEDHLKLFLNEWKRWSNARKPAQFPELFIGLPPGFRFFPDSLPMDYERDFFGQLSLDALLRNPKWAEMWERMRRGEWTGRGPARALIDYRTDGAIQVTLE